MTILTKLKEDGLVAVVRGSSEENIIPICQALAKGGITAIEITAETKGAPAVIEKAVREMGEDILVGAGTVLDSATAVNMLAAGAKFVVSPTLNTETIQTVKRYGAISIPGALTPTEILTAFEHGADIVKVFPASVFGSSYVKNVHGPLPQIPLMVTGGIQLENIAEYVAAGALCIGLGSNLVHPNSLKTDADYETLVKRAKQFRKAFTKAKHK